VRLETIIESAPTVLQISAAEAEALNRAGQQLASERGWWGEEEALSAASVIRCAQTDTGAWKITVSEAIGLVVVGDTLQLQVLPKIPISHLLFLFERAGALPRMAPGQGEGGPSASLWQLVAEWFVLAAERVLRRDLTRDYRAIVDEISVSRGTLVARETSNAYYAGRLSMVCEFDEFDTDTALNRFLKAASRTVAGSGALRPSTRMRASRLVARMEDVGLLSETDWLVTLDSHTAHYSDALLLAKQVLRAVGRSLEAGSESVWTFLIRTPDLVESGLRAVLKEGCGLEIRKRSIRLSSTVSFNPDLVVVQGGEARAVADVKYKLASGDWRRADLYQVVAFATALQVTSAAVIDFMPSASALTPLNVGGTRVTHLAWPADEAQPPEQSATTLTEAFHHWIAQSDDQTASHT
jgi:5-methylcytosine-specific restriction endonuclease McrBC regulatory subunit McrC